MQPPIRRVRRRVMSIPRSKNMRLTRGARAIALNHAGKHRNRWAKAGGWAEIILVEPDVVSTIEGNVIMRKHALRRRIAAVAAAWASTLLLLLWWYLATRCPADARPLPSPAEVVGAWNDLDAEGLLWPSIGISLLRVASGLALGIVLAVPAGLIAGASRMGLAIIDKPIHMLRAVHRRVRHRRDDEDRADHRRRVRSGVREPA